MNMFSRDNVNSRWFFRRKQLSANLIKLLCLLCIGSLSAFNLNAKPINFTSLPGNLQGNANISLTDKIDPYTKITIRDNNDKVLSQSTGRNFKSETNQKSIPLLNPVTVTPQQRAVIIEQSLVITSGLNSLKDELTKISRQLNPDTNDLKTKETNYKRTKKGIVVPFLNGLKVIKESLENAVKMQEYKDPYNDGMLPSYTINLQTINPTKFMRETDVIYNAIENTLISIEKKFSWIWDNIRIANFKNIEEDLNKFTKDTFKGQYQNQHKTVYGDRLSGVRYEEVMITNSNKVLTVIDLKSIRNIKDSYARRQALWAKASDIWNDKSGVTQEVVKFLEHIIKEADSGKFQVGYNDEKDLITASVDKNGKRFTLFGYINSKTNKREEYKTITKKDNWNLETEINKLNKKTARQKKISVNNNRSYLEIYKYIKSNALPVSRGRFTPASTQQLETRIKRNGTGVTQEEVIRTTIDFNGKKIELTETSAGKKTLTDSTAKVVVNKIFKSFAASFSAIGEVVGGVGAKALQGYVEIAGLFTDAHLVNEYKKELSKSASDNITNNSIKVGLSGFEHKAGSNNISVIHKRLEGIKNSDLPGFMKSGDFVRFNAKKLPALVKGGSFALNIVGNVLITKGYSALKANRIARAEATGKPTIWNEPIKQTMKRWGNRIKDRFNEYKVKYLSEHSKSNATETQQMIDYYSGQIKKLPSLNLQQKNKLISKLKQSVKDSRDSEHFKLFAEDMLRDPNLYLYEPIKMHPYPIAHEIGKENYYKNSTPTNEMNYMVTKAAPREFLLGKKYPYYGKYYKEFKDIHKKMLVEAKKLKFRKSKKEFWDRVTNAKLKIKNTPQKFRNECNKALKEAKKMDEIANLELQNKATATTPLKEQKSQFGVQQLLNKLEQQARKGEFPKQEITIAKEELSNFTSFELNEPSLANYIGNWQHTNQFCFDFQVLSSARSWQELKKTLQNLIMRTSITRVTF